MSFNKACCTLPPVSSSYLPQGTTISLGDLNIYETASVPNSKPPKTLIICAYDIFGVHPNTQQLCDKLANSGRLKVVMPDFFRGQPLSEDDLALSDWMVLKPFSLIRRYATLIRFIFTRGSFDKVVKPDINKLVEHYKAQGFEKFGMFGLCWGGKMGMLAAGQLHESIGAAVLIHPSILKTADAEAAKVPVMLLPTKDENDQEMLGYYNIIKNNLGEEKAAHHRFSDMHHGFCGARGDWTKEEQRQKVDEAIQLTYAFFERHLS